LGSKKGRGPLEKSKEMHHYIFCPRKKKIISHTLRIKGTLVFLCPYIYDRLREGGERGKERERERERERENTKVGAIIFPNRPSQN
jgi:hypothetical protein